MEGLDGRIPCRRFQVESMHEALVVEQLFVARITHQSCCRCLIGEPALVQRVQFAHVGEALNRLVRMTQLQQNRDQILVGGDVVR